MLPGKLPPRCKAAFNLVSHCPLQPDFSYGTRRPRLVTVRINVAQNTLRVSASRRHAARGPHIRRARGSCVTCGQALTRARREGSPRAWRARSRPGRFAGSAAALARRAAHGAAAVDLPSEVPRVWDGECSAPGLRDQVRTRWALPVGRGGCAGAVRSERRGALTCPASPGAAGCAPVGRARGASPGALSLRGPRAHGVRPAGRIRVRRPCTDLPGAARLALDLRKGAGIIRLPPSFCMHGWVNTVGYANSIHPPRVPIPHSQHHARYTALGLATCLGALYAMYLKLPSTQLCQLEKMLAMTEGLIGSAKAQCPGDQLSLAEKWYFRVRYSASVIKYSILDTPMFTWTQYRLLSREMAEHITHVKSIHTAVQLTIEAECQRKLTTEIDDAEFILCSTSQRGPQCPINLSPYNSAYGRCTEVHFLSPYFWCKINQFYGRAIGCDGSDTTASAFSLSVNEPIVQDSQVQRQDAATDVNTRSAYAASVIGYLVEAIKPIVLS
ncbi:hypothetical protein DFH09DRAFT_1116040 [Mycena vulgaris]|nr:hypothetical protein DFH09DRAFT_1116040 [Mycena vulgaris]